MKKFSVSLDSNTPIPEFSLPSTNGGAPMGTATFKQQDNLLLFFFHDWSCDQCRAMLRELKEHADTYRWLDTRIVAIASSPLADLAPAAVELEPDILMLYDGGGKVTDAFRTVDAVFGAPDAPGPGPGGDNPFVVVADRYGAFFGRMEVEPGEDLDFGEIESLLMFIETQCPECGRPVGDTYA